MDEKYSLPGHGTMPNVVVILLLAALAVCGGVVLAALGRAGELAMFPGDCAPLDLEEEVTAADVAMLRPPMALWGYQVQATEEALQLIARSVTARDTEIAALRQQLAGLRGGGAGPAADRPALAPWPRADDETVWPGPGPEAGGGVWPGLGTDD